MSRDGLSWDWTERLGPDGELGVGSDGAFDDEQRSYPTVVSSGENLHCWFTGNRFGRNRHRLRHQPVGGMKLNV